MNINLQIKLWMEYKFTYYEWNINYEWNRHKFTC